MFCFQGPQRTCLDPKVVVVLLHGYGSTGADLLSLAPLFDLPDAFFWSPNAPNICEDYPQGNQWFSFQDSQFFSLADTPVGTHRPLWPTLMPRVAQASHHLAQDLVAGLGDFDGPVVVAGFSQGAAVAGHLALFDLPISGSIFFSGIYPLSQAPRYRPAIQVLSGLEDSVVPAPWIHECAHSLRTHDVPTDLMLFQGVDHKICPQALAMAREFIVQRSLAWNTHPGPALTQAMTEMWSS